jgi:hypothetical protein
MVRSSRRRSRAPLAVLAIVLSLLAGCAMLPTSPQISQTSPTSATSTEEPAGEPSQVRATATPQSGRPVQPVPDVRPAGFASPPEGTGLQRYLDQQIDWDACGNGLQCATELAPLDYDEPDVEAITLALAKRPAGAEPRAGSLFVNPGGPGGSGVAYARSFEAEGLERYDIVGWDPRGTGASTPVKCANGGAMDAYTSVDISPDDAGEQRALEEAQLDFGRGCLARSGALLEHISTTETVRDLDLLRQLVGDEKLSFFGS